MVNFATRYRNAKWLSEKGYSPKIYVFRNLESGQVVYSQLPYFSSKQIKKQFQRPNWQNRLPSLRKDIWRVMAVMQLKDHTSAVDAYDALVELRHLREKSQKAVANSYRKKNEEGNIWFSNQYRPTWIQESVADISTVVDELKLKNTKIFWEELWRKGEDKYWNTELVEHKELGKFNPREESVVLKRLDAETRELGEDIGSEAEAAKNGEAETVQAASA